MGGPKTQYLGRQSSKWVLELNANILRSGLSREFSLSHALFLCYVTLSLGSAQAYGQMRTVIAHITVSYLSPSIQGFVTQPQKCPLGLKLEGKTSPACEQTY